MPTAHRTPLPARSKGAGPTASFRPPTGLADGQFQITELYLKETRIANHINTLSAVFENGAPLPSVDEMPTALQRVRDIDQYTRWLPKAQEALHWTRVEILYLDRWMQTRRLRSECAAGDALPMTDGNEAAERLLAVIEGLESKGADLDERARLEVKNGRLFLHDQR